MKLKENYIYHAITNSDGNEFTNQYMLVTNIIHRRNSHDGFKGIRLMGAGSDTWEINESNIHEERNQKNYGWVFKEIGHKDDHPEYYL